MKKIIFTSAVLFALLASCVSNDDQPDKPIVDDRDPVPLSKVNLEGTWQVYYVSKQTIAPNMNINTTYRDTETDGFSATFFEDGTYNEKNAFGDITRVGTYTITKRDANSIKDDLLKFEYWRNDTLRKSQAYVPHLFDESFTYYYAYSGTAQGHNFNVEDIRYYRHTKRAPNYLPTGSAFNKIQIANADFIGHRWEFYNYQERIDQRWSGPNDSIAAQMGLHYFYQNEKSATGLDSLYWYEFLPDDLQVANRKGSTIIIDDVIHMKWSGWVYIEIKDTEGNVTVKKEWQTKSFSWWIYKMGKTSTGAVSIVDRAAFRDQEDVLKDKEQLASYRKVPGTRSFSLGGEIPVRAVAMPVHSKPLRYLQR